MIRLLPVLSLLAVPAVSVVPANAASFDCAKATTPFEKVICSDDGLGLADERLARTYSFALAGLSEKAAASVKRDQQAWLAYAQKACTDNNEVLRSGSYDERMTWCLSSLYTNRLNALELSRFVRGERIYPLSQFSSSLDSYIEEDPDFRWPVTQHELTVAQIDSDEAFAAALNAALRAEGERRSSASADVSTSDDDTSGSEDSSVVIDVQQGFWEHRVSFTVESSWYPHGAAHGGHTTTFLHYLNQQGRFATAEDLFEGETWQADLAKMAARALETQLGPILFPDADDAETLEAIVSDVSRWDLSNNLGLTIQFQPYEVTAYVYGTPTIFILWDELEPLLKDVDLLR
jgi:uncharacterized protein